MSDWQSVGNTVFRRLLFSCANVLPGVALDRAVGDPGGAWHPVAVFGRYAGALEQRLWADDRARGAVFCALSVAPPVAASWWVWRRFPHLSNAAALAVALGGTTLERTGVKVAHDLERGDVEAARAWVPWLCSRDPHSLDADGIARATVESLAENVSDAAVASLFWSAFGAPWVVLHRCANTLDAMVGYRNERYRNFGWACAKLDDALAFIPARLCAALFVAASFPEGRGREAIRAWREDASAHPSPNAGPVEATAAAALGVCLGGATRYAHGVEQRPVLGRGRAPRAGDVRAAVRLIRRTQWCAVGVSVALGALVARSGA
ncbi:adenosylcobinamide-phosphate synthase CbiB [Corynebacterium gerontici]|uniref:Cobalamin biosynthesis protein CobD n=1 Tax=Corynebacterium gerontici TaxID=2079234 RepID=A0A3G6J1F1_9CORY|nr:adenosylcobinamide-phosphate synthase CbiB [Corynebacterium gerontici]AZA11851.1 cobalamin biosynthesis protein [Corynebacterium gerontici]